MYSINVIMLIITTVCTDQTNLAVATQLDDHHIDPALKFINSVEQLLETIDHIKLTPQQTTSQGRGKKGYLMAIPLIIGFKIASVVVAATSALKVLVVKTVLLSGLALIASLAIAAKYVYEKIKLQHPAMQAAPYYLGHQQAQQVAWEPIYEFPGGQGDFQQDLQGHNSNPLVHTTATGNHNVTAFGYVPGIAERKSLPYRPPQLYKTTIYKTTVKQIDK